MRILTDCEHCGEAVGIEPARAWLVVFREPARSRPLPPRFGFDCPVCSRSCETAVTPEQRSRLARAGVEVALLDDPRERHPSARGRRLRDERAGAVRPFTEDDARALHDLLSDENWFAALLAVDQKPAG